MDYEHNKNATGVLDMRYDNLSNTHYAHYTKVKNCVPRQKMMMKIIQMIILRKVMWMVKRIIKEIKKNVIKNAIKDKQKISVQTSEKSLTHEEKCR